MDRALILGVLASLAATTAAPAAPRSAAGVPLPPPKPPELRAPTPEAPAAPPKKVEPPPPAHDVEAPAQSEGGSCVARLQARGYDLRAASPAEATRAACKIADPVSLHAVTDGRHTVRVQGELVLDCRTAEALGSWLTGVAAPVLEQTLGSPLRAVRDVGGYECRNRNRRPDGKISAHAEGLAVDIGGFELANGTTVSVGKVDETWREAFAALRKAACGWFLTVLGPGTDAEHASHLHLDLLQHGTSDRYRICQ